MADSNFDCGNFNNFASDYGLNNTQVLPLVTIMSECKKNKAIISLFRINSILATCKEKREKIFNFINFALHSTLTRHTWFILQMLICIFKSSPY